MTNTRSKFWKAIPYLLGLVFLVGGVYKGLLPGSAHLAITKLGAKHSVATPILWVTITVEMYLAIGLCFSAFQSRFVKLSVYLLVVFTVFLGALYLNGGRSCGCTGVENIFGEAVNPLLVGLFRNVALIVLAESYLWRVEPQVASEL